ncbi:hypothetical protein DSO57_1014610 [Entomophthora muscae]|uniref:Uncharacterized protein n=1 Tax=Entomophthora muscae TaxID=34485 RepID=A0ACC2USH6_9FUNG|nr:hypothetical protein DSO57_1014610 [Entomophthora muscae]
MNSSKPETKAPSALALLPLMNPSSTRDKTYLADDLYLNPSKRPKLPFTLPKVYSSEKKPPERVFKDVWTERRIHAATCGFNFRPYTPYLSARKYPTVTIQHLIERRRREREENRVLDSSSELDSTAYVLPKVSSNPVESTREPPKEDSTLRVVSAFGVSEFMFNDTMDYFRDFGKNVIN